MSEPKEGMVISEGGKFYLDLAGARLELLPQIAGGEETLKAMVGQNVEVLYSEPSRFVVGLQAGRRPPILCYIPPVTYTQAGVTAEAARAEEFRVGSPTGAAVRVYIPTCYIPQALRSTGIEREVRQNIANQLLQEGIISADVHEKLIGGTTSP